MPFEKRCEDFLPLSACIKPYGFRKKYCECHTFFHSDVPCEEELAVAPGKSYSKTSDKTNTLFLFKSSLCKDKCLHVSHLKGVPWMSV